MRVAAALAGSAALAGVFLLLSAVRQAVLVLGPVGRARVRESHPVVGRYFQSGYLRSPSRVRTSLQLATQFSLAGSVLLMAAALAGLTPAARWGGTTAFGVAVPILGGQVLARLLATLRPEACLVQLLWLVKGADLLLWPVARPLGWLHERAAAQVAGEADDVEAQDEEIEAYIDVGEKEGLLEEGEGRLIRGVLDFGDRVVREVMTPRTRMVAVAADATVAQLRELVVREKHSRLPVYRGNLDEIAGVVFVRDLLEVLGKVPDSSTVRRLIRPAYFVPETKRVSELLRELQRRRTHLAIIVDEYGGTAGLVTIEDLIEEIVGEIQDEHEPEEDVIQPQQDGALIVHGGADIERVADALEVDLPADEFDTVGGFILTALGRVPQLGERFEHRGLAVEVLAADGRQVHRARIRKLDPPPGEPTEQRP